MDNLIDSVTKDIRYVIKRSGDKVVFKSEKIETAILNAMKSIDKVDENMAEKIARLTTKGLFRGNKERVPNVDEIHDFRFSRGCLGDETDGQCGESGAI